MKKKAYLMVLALCAALAITACGTSTDQKDDKKPAAEAQDTTCLLYTSKGVTLREVYHQFCQDGTLPWLPEIWVEGELLEVDYGSNE